MENNHGIIIGRYINGISINGLEYMNDNSGEVVHFKSLDCAKQFLRDHGVEEDELDDLFDYRFHTKCICCGYEFVLDLSEMSKPLFNETDYCCDRCLQEGFNSIIFNDK